MRDWWKNHSGALITGGMAVIAAAMAAFFTASATKDVVREEGRQLAVRDDEAARGAARILLAEFLVVGEELADWTTTAQLKPFGPDFPVDVSPRSLELIATRVTPRQWNAISRALADLTQLRRYVRDRTAQPSRFKGRLISRNIVFMVARDLDSVRRGSLALAGVAGVGDEVPGTTMEPEVVFSEIQRKSRVWGIPIAPD
jgi:hypothetical protein